MTDRWWTPEGPNLGMTTGDLQLLIQGSDPNYDLGSALFALHRAGAAACEHAAKVPLVDGQVLAESLIASRAAYAPPVVQAVSKSLGDPTYAGLLVRDVADAAESGCMDLFRQAVAKGVAPPLAAQRAGMVYGVPAHGMGAFRALACTPAANPIALADAADRALFAHIGSVVQAEVVEGVAKAEKYLERHNETQDEGGRFTRLQTAQQHTEVELNALLNPAPIKERKERGERKERKERVERKVRLETVVPSSALAEREHKQRDHGARAHKMRELVARTAGTKLKRLKAPEPLVPLDPVPEGDWKHYETLNLDVNEAVSMFVDGGTMLGLDAVLEQNEGLFDMGTVTGHADPVVTRTDLSTIDHRQTSSDTAYHVASRQQKGQPRPTTLYIDEHSDYEDAIDHAVRKWLNENSNGAWGQEEYNEITERTSAGNYAHIQVLSERVGPGYYVVVAPDGVAALNEIRVSGSHSEIRGELGSAGHVELDPSQSYTLTGDNHGHPTYTETWDEKIGAIVHVYHATPIADEDDDYEFGKAQDYLKTHNETQDAKGHFSRLSADDLNALMEQSKEALSMKKTRKVRGERKERSERKERVEPNDIAQALRHYAERKHAEREHTARTPLDRARAARSYAAKQPAPLAPGRLDHRILFSVADQDYAVVEPRVMDQMMAHDGVSGFVEDAEKEWQLSHHARLRLLHGDVVQGEGLDARLDQMSRDEQLGKGGQVTDRERFLGRHRIMNAEDLDDLSLALTGYQHIRVRLAADAQGQVYASVWRNAHDLPTLSVISFTGEADPDKMHTLTPGAVYRLHNEQSIGHWLHSLYSDFSETANSQYQEDVLANPTIKTWVADTD